MNFVKNSKLQIPEELATLLSGKKATRVLLYPMTKEYEVLLSLIIIQVASSCQNLLRNFFFEHDFQSSTINITIIAIHFHHQLMNERQPLIFIHTFFAKKKLSSAFESSIEVELSEKCYFPPPSLFFLQFWKVV